MKLIVKTWLTEKGRKCTALVCADEQGETLKIVSFDFQVISLLTGLDARQYAELKVGDATLVCKV